jgi:hypothetical protein
MSKDDVVTLLYVLFVWLLMGLVLVVSGFPEMPICPLLIINPEKCVLLGFHWYKTSFPLLALATNLETAGLHLFLHSTTSTNLMHSPFSTPCLTPQWVMNLPCLL